MSSRCHVASQASPWFCASQVRPLPTPVEHLLMMLSLLTSLKTLDNTRHKMPAQSLFPPGGCPTQCSGASIYLTMPITPHGQTTPPAETPWAEFHAAKPKCHLPCANCQCLARGREQLGAHLLPMGRQLNDNLSVTHSISLPAKGVFPHM